jgi:lysophospholipase L1-like esterase
MKRLGPIVAVALALLAPAVAHPQSLYLALGDSVTYGIGDIKQPGGYPPRLEFLLRETEPGAIVENWGEAGETTAETLSRTDSVLARDGDHLLLMAGTNDVNLIVGGELSVETTVDNLDRIARKAEDAGARPLHATVIPRQPDALADSRNLFTLDLNWRIRDLAVRTQRALADPWHFFEPDNNPDVFTTLFSGDDEDPVGHPGPAGYDLLAEIFGDVLQGRDTVPPVMGVFTPGPIVSTINPDAEIQVTLFEPHSGAGIRLDATRLLINGREIAEPRPEATAHRVELRHQGEEALGCKAVISVISEDRSADPNRLERQLRTYDIRGRNLIEGDLDFDCRVDAVDLTRLSTRLGATVGDGLYRRLYDLDRNGVIDAGDLDKLAKNFGKSSA